MDLLFTMGAWQQIERKLWPLDEMEQRLSECVKSPEGIITLCELVAILANAAAEADNKSERIAAEDVIKTMTVEAIPGTIREISTAMVHGMTVHSSKVKKPRAVDVTLEELNRRDGKNRMAWRKYAGYGLIAGVSIRDQRICEPGALVDWYLQRQGYDDEQHRLKRKRKE